MEKVQVYVGSRTLYNNHTQDNLRLVEFEAKELAEISDGIGDSRGTTETLYGIGDGRLVVFVQDWSNWQGESTVQFLQEVTETDLTVNGKFEFLGAKAGFGRPLTLEEALEA